MCCCRLLFQSCSNTQHTQELWSAPGHPISGPLEYRHVYVDITDVQVEATEFTHAGHTCPGAMGYSFAAGTTDGERQSSTVSVTCGSTRPRVTCRLRPAGWYALMPLAARRTVLARSCPQRRCSQPAPSAAPLPNTAPACVWPPQPPSSPPVPSCRSRCFRFFPRRPPQRRRPHPLVSTCIPYQWCLQGRGQPCAAAVPGCQASAAECGGGLQALPLGAKGHRSGAVAAWQLCECWKLRVEGAWVDMLSCSIAMWD
jgi:hypothetical protein